MDSLKSSGHDFIIEALKSPAYLETIVGLDNHKDINESDFDWDEEDDE